MGPVVEILTKSLKMGAQSCKKVVALAWDSQGGEGGWGPPVRCRTCLGVTHKRGFRGP